MGTKYFISLIKKVNHSHNKINKYVHNNTTSIKIIIIIVHFYTAHIWVGKDLCITWLLAFDILIN